MTNYDQIAEWYDASVRNGSLVHDLVMPCLFDLVGEVKGLHICDLACGQGVLTRELARRGASVVGIDIAAQLLAIARREEVTEPLGITYLHDDAQTLSTIPTASFDGVMCDMALMDIPDIQATFHAIQRILHPHGWFACSITHPCFQTPNSQWLDETNGTISRVVQRYFHEGFWCSDNPKGVRGQVGAHHRTLSTYINALLAAGLSITRIIEPQANGRIAQRVPGYAEVPVAIVMLCRKL